MIIALAASAVFVIDATLDILSQLFNYTQVAVAASPSLRLPSR